MSGLAHSGRCTCRHLGHHFARGEEIHIPCAVSTAEHRDRPMSEVMASGLTNQNGRCWAIGVERFMNFRLLRWVDSEATSSFASRQRSTTSRRGAGDIRLRQCVRAVRTHHVASSSSATVASLRFFPSPGRCRDLKMSEDRRHALAIMPQQHSSSLGVFRVQWASSCVLMGVCVEFEYVRRD